MTSGDRHRPLTIAIAHHIQDGPWGGGNAAVRAISEELESRGHSVRFDLNHPGIDLILMTEVRQRSPQVPFGHGAMARYRLSHPGAIIVHRINECDERKGTSGMNRRLRLANLLAHHTVFIGEWLKDLDLWTSCGDDSFSVIPNGGDTRLFHDRGFEPWEGSGPIKLVTHHWGANRLKGFDVYEHLDALLDDPDQKARFQLTYIGNLPPGFAFRNVIHKTPLSGEPLAEELRSHHAYITASQNEPAGMHHIEGALSGLPLLFRNSGALPEYGTGFGVSFNGPLDVEQALAEMRRDYTLWRERLAAYPFTADLMAGRYADLFENLCRDREPVLARRPMLHHPIAFLAAQVPF
ncbi:MAG: hypothetical protein ACPGOV_14590 [Magnetovibrionaceae bacterium]